IAASCSIVGATFSPASTLITDVQSLIDGLRTTTTPDPITGYVTNSSGSGISGSILSIIDGLGHTVATATTDMTGFYVFATTCVLASGANYTVQVTSFPAGFSISTPASQALTWQGTGMTFNFSLN